jgi:hypothetical protein
VTATIRVTRKKEGAFVHPGQLRFKLLSVESFRAGAKEFKNVRGLTVTTAPRVFSKDGRDKATLV